MLARVKSWEEYQHYSNRNPPWIKLHRGLLDDYDYWSLPIASRAIAPAIWLLASGTDNGTVDISPEFLAFRLRMSLSDVEKAVSPLVSGGWLIPLADASNRYQNACLEKEKRESKSREREEGEARVFDAWLSTQGGRDLKLTPSRRKKIQARLNEGYSVDDLCDAVRGWIYDDWKDRPMHCDITQLLGTGDKAEKWRDLYRASSRKGDNSKPPGDRFASVARASIESAGELSDDDREHLMSLVAQPEAVCAEFESLTGRPLI